MAETTVSRGIRLPPELVKQIEVHAKQSGATFNRTIREAAEAMLSPENTTAALGERIENLEESVFRLVSILQDFFPTLAEAEDKAFRSWSSSRLILAWADLVVESGGMPTPAKWHELKSAQMKEFSEQRTRQKMNLVEVVKNES